MLRAAYEAELPARCFCGQTVQYRLTARHMAKLPVSRCRLRLTVSDAVGGEVRQQKLELAGTLGFALRIDTRHAGVQTFQPSKGRVCDALGLFSLPLRLPDACSIAVEPEPQEPPELPNLSHFQYRSYHPKPGGGFSEIHDLREYRPGDSLHEIHWKLSAKTDKLIVREAEEPDLGLVVLSFDFSGTRTQLDSTLRQLLWLSGWLTEREVAHQIDWIEPDSLEPQTKSVKTPDDLRELLNTLLQTHLTGNTPCLRPEPTRTRIGAIMCSRRNRRCSRHETVKIYVLYVPALCLWSVCRAVLLRDDLVCRPGGRPFAGMRVRPCGAALFRAAPAAEKLGLAADHGCTCGRRALYPACAADREHFRACGRRNTAILRGDSGHSDRSSDRYFRMDATLISDPDCSPLCASLQLDGHAQ